MTRRRVRRLLLPPMPPRASVVYDADPSARVDGSKYGMVAGYTDIGKAEIHVPPGAPPFSLAHETGHLLDAQALSDGDRHFFTRILGLPEGQWDTGTGAAGGYHSPKEAFADYYAAEATGWRPPHKIPGGGVASSGTDSYTPIGPRRMRRFAAALERLQRRQGLADYRSPDA